MTDLLLNRPDVSVLEADTQASAVGTERTDFAAVVSERLTRAHRGISEIALGSIGTTEISDLFDDDLAATKTAQVSRSELRYSELSRGFTCLQSWEGVVLSIDADCFVALLEDSRADGEDVEAEIYLSELSDGDRERLRVGAVFYWTIGYRVESRESKERVSAIRFSILPSKSDGDIEGASDWADEVTRGLGWLSER